MKYSRRHLISRFATGSSPLVLQSLLQQLRVQAAGRPEAVPQRFVFIVKSSGIVPEGITPPGLEGTDPRSVSLQNIPLHPSMSPLEPFRDQLALIQGLSGKMCRGGHSSWFGAMGVYMTGGEHDRGAILRATVDAELAKLNPAPFQHVGLAVRGPALSSSWGGVLYPGITRHGRQRPAERGQVVRHRQGRPPDPVLRP